MADYFCDHGAYGLTTNRLGLDAPTWGVPQEGDGTNKDAATASSVASVDLTSITSTAGTFSLFGSAAISVGASASGATLATQIAAAINASTVTTGNTAIFPGAPQLRNAFFAQATGATLEIMCRIGSTLTNVLGMTWAGTWAAGPPSNLTFTGGSGGCWGWFWSTEVALGVAGSITPYSYGAWLTKPYAGPNLTETDTIYVRTGGGASKTITTSITNTYRNIYHHSLLSKNIVFDTNTKWTGDSPTGTLKVVISLVQWDGSYTLSLIAGTGYTSTYTALRLGGFELEVKNAGAGPANMSLTLGPGRYAAKNIVYRDSFETVASSGYFSPFNGGGQNPTNAFTHENCYLVVTYGRPTIRAPIAIAGIYNGQSQQRHYGCTFDFNISGASDPGPVIYNWQMTETEILLKDCQFLGYAPGYKLFTSAGSWPTAAARLNITVDGCSGLAMPSGYLGLPTATYFRQQDTHLMVFSNVADSVSPGLRVENCRGVAEWVPNDPTPFPYLNSTIPGSGAPWSIRLIWLQAVTLTRATAYEAPPLRMYNQLAAGVRTLTLQLFMPTIVTGGMIVGFGYKDSLGNARFETTEAISASAATWGNAASYAGSESRLMSLTTSYSVAANSEVVCIVQMIAPAPAAAVHVYLEPEFTVA